MLGAQFNQKLARTAALRHKHGAPHEFAGGPGALAGFVPKGEQVLYIYDALDVVQRFAVNRDARDSLCQRQLHHIVRGGGVRNGHQLGAVRHDVARRHIGQLEDVGNHLLLALIYHIMFFAFIHHVQQVFLRYGCTGLNAAQAEHQFCGRTEHSTCKTCRAAPPAFFAACRTQGKAQHPEHSQQGKASKAPPHARHAGAPEKGRRSRACRTQARQHEHANAFV